MSAKTSPLIQRELDSVFARVSQWGFASLSDHSEAVTAKQFLSDASCLAERLPAQRYVINLCQNRYLFTVAFAATVSAERTNLLPQNRTLSTQQQLIDEYSDCCIVHDGLEELLAIPSVNIGNTLFTRCAEPANPNIPLDHIAALAFTSGSTGVPKPNVKTWRTFIESTAINARHMLPNLDDTFSCLATVPGQHMWGLETSVLMPLFNKVSVSDKKPLFPQDIANQLASLPEPRILVSTPVHLRALVQSGVQFPKLERVLCATAPLSPMLAADSEKMFSSDLIEVFGCSEVGSMARKRSATEASWELFGGLHIEDSTVYADHLPGAVALQDHFDFSDKKHFTLTGRNEDIIEVAGKRGSLMELNKVLLECPGVDDGVVFIPDADNQVARPAALVASSQKLERTIVQDFFAKHLDPVFTPRPIYFVEQLPREENGKLKRSKVLSLYSELKG